MPYCTLCGEPLRIRKEGKIEWDTRPYHVKCNKDYLMYLENGAIIHTYDRETGKKISSKQYNKETGTYRYF